MGSGRFLECARDATRGFEPQRSLLVTKAAAGGPMTAGSESKAGWTVIRPPSGIPWPNLRELWGARDLLLLLARRDVLARYKQTAAGALWAILQPLLLAIVFSVFLGLVARVPSQKGIPYPLFA